MKAIKNISVILLGLLFLTACSSSKDQAESSETSDPEASNATTEATTEAIEKPAKFSATVSSIELEGDNKQLVLVDVVASKDSGDISASLESDGVIFNLEGDESPELSKLAAGSKVQVTVSMPAIMTMSIPPQIPGRFIEEIKLLDE